jgi:16S rRNA (uracil1498-N3)-methyltransferase
LCPSWFKLLFLTRRRWIADEVSGNRAFLFGAHADHLARVLRARVGQEFDITTASEVRRGHIISISADRVEFELGEQITVSPNTQVTLLLSIFKFDRMEWAIEKCAELGVSRIVPLIARRTETHLAATAAKRIERWRRIVVQAAEQSRRSLVPEVCQPLKLKDALRLPGGTRIVLSELESEVKLKHLLQSSSDGEVVIAIGPEGGWTTEELREFREASWISASLGSTILRAETAAIAATAIIQSELS